MSNFGVVVQLSGGYDSAAALVHMLRACVTSAVMPAGLRGEPHVHCLHFVYDQPYAALERGAVELVYSALEAREEYAPFLRGLDVVRLPAMQQRGGKGVSPHCFPMRNLVFGAYCAAYAQARGCTVIATGTKTDQFRDNDDNCFRDCTTAFFTALEDCIRVASELSFVPPTFLRPVAGLSKAQVMRVLDAEGILGLPRSCYQPTEDGEPCGACYPCTTVAKAKKELADARVHA